MDDDDIVKLEMRQRAAAADNKLTARALVVALFMLCSTTGWCCHVIYNPGPGKHGHR